MEVVLVEKASDVPPGCTCYYVSEAGEDAAVRDFTLMKGVEPDVAYRHGVALWLHPNQSEMRKRPPKKKKKSPVEDFFEDD